jgi:hypothetical protein
MAWLTAEFASHAGAIARIMAFNTTGVASAGERALHPGISAVGLVVTVYELANKGQCQLTGVHLPDLAAVEALARQTAALRLVGTFASEVTDLAAAVVCQYSQ